MTQTQSDQSQATAPPTDDDPLAHLHKMSTTAGLGSGEYVAVNGTAVFALLLGLASSLALMDSMLLIIPLIGVIVAIVALRQIILSNGTQTGRGLVVLGTLLMFGFGGFVGVQKIVQDVRTREDRQAIENVVTALADKSKAGDYQGLYGLFAGKFQERVKYPDFAERMKSFRESAVYGKLKSAETGLMQFQTDDATGTQYALVRVQLDFEKANRPLPDDLTFKKEGNHWRIEVFATMFPPPTARQ